MDDEGKHDVHSNTHLQISDAAFEHSDSTDSDIKQNKMYSAESADCGMSVDIPIHCTDDYNVLQGMTYAREQPEDVQADNAFCRQIYGIHGHMVKCLSRVKCEGHMQELNEQSHALPFIDTDQETNWTRDADETIQVKQEKKEYPDGYDRSSEVTRHWVVCPDGVLKEVKAEHVSDVSEILAIEDCNENVNCKLRTRTCTHHNNIHDEEMNGMLTTDSTCDVSPTQSRRHDNVLKVHKRTSEGVEHYNCDACGKQFAYINKLKLHEVTHRPTDVKPFTCDTFGKPFVQLGHLKQHDMRRECVKPFRCDTCGKSFTQSGYLKRHEMTHTGIKPFSCDACGKSFARVDALKVHEMKHSGIKHFTCDTCAKSFARLADLAVHEMIHTGVKPFTCDTCGKSFLRSGDLKGHEMIHTGVKPFTCDTCGKAFTRSGDLKKHERIHTGVKPFTCETCGKSFAQSGQLKTHEMRHKGIKPFRCDTCGKSFTQPWELKLHERVHTGVKPFTCDTCGKAYTRSGHLKQHKIRHTGVKGAS